MKVLAFGGTHPGKVREHNEDFYILMPSLGYYAVCDGMGGHAAGEVASEMTARVLGDRLALREDLWKHFKDTPTDRARWIEAVKKAIEESSEVVHKHAQAHRGEKGMGTTLAMIHIVKNKAILAHVGDSRIYLLRENEWHQMTEDHNYRTGLIKAGMTPEQASRSPWAHRLTRAIGPQEVVQADLLITDLLDGDRLLICSDGLWQYMEGRDDEVKEIFKHSLDQVPQKLIDLALAGGGEDNITAVVLGIEAEHSLKKEEKRRSMVIHEQVQLLKDVQLFQGLSLRELVFVMSRFWTDVFAQGTELIREGESDDRLFILTRGKVEVLKNGVPVSRLEKGNHFGEMALIREAPRSATVRALTQVETMIMEREDFETILKKAPNLGIKILKTLAKSLSERLDEASLWIAREEKRQIK